MGWKPKHGRIKEKYDPKPNAEERRHEERLEKLPCIGCGRWGVECHHTMLDVPGKRFRRDHRFQVPVCPECHRGRHGIHGIGNERKWWMLKGWSFDEAAAWIVRQWEISSEG